MSDFENELYEVLMSHREAVVDRVRLRGLLQDCFPKNKQIINLMFVCQRRSKMKLGRLSSCRRWCMFTEDRCRKLFFKPEKSETLTLTL